MDRNYLRIFWVSVICYAVLCFSVYSMPVSITDAAGHRTTLTKSPERVVSLVPSVTEIIYELGAADAVKGVTYHDVHFPGVSEKAVVGGFFEPSVTAVDALEPDMIIISSLHKKVKQRFLDTGCILLEVKTTSIADSFEDILLMGRIFGKETRAAEIVSRNKQALDLIARKIAGIPEKDRKRVIRLMGRDRIMTTGTDSFQNEMIRAAGGITHDFNRNGNIIEVSEQEWKRFNPQIIYGCGGDQKAVDAFFDKPGWKDVDGVKNHQIYNFPCDLTCRASTHTGYFVSWLAADIYGEAFAEKENLVMDQGVVSVRNLSIGLPYIKDIRILDSRICDFLNKSLVIQFRRPMTIVSTLEGRRTDILTAGNHYSPPQYWAVAHQNGLEGHRERVYRTMGLDEQTSSFLFTGADMDNLAMTRSTYKDLTVHALVTAGVASNAMRMSRDDGGYYEPGTINIIIMTNMKLTPRAMTRAIISATEAKTAALLDMDIRSIYGRGAYRATGTGTDNVLVVEGTGTLLKNAGGHTKLGEQIARAVYDGVCEAVGKQNRLTASRNIFQRLKERDITVYGLIAKEKCDCGRDRSDFTGAVEALLLDPEYEGFIAAALALSDDYDKGLVKDLTLFRAWARQTAESVSGKAIPEMKDIADTKNLSPVMGIAMNALMNGIYFQENTE